MKTIIYIILSFSLSSTSMAVTSSEMTYQSALTQWENQKKKDGWLDHAIKSTEFSNEHRVDERGNCYNRALGTAKLITIMNAEGVVTEVIADVKNLKSACFISAFNGVKFPPPPFSPYYGNWEML